MQRAGTAALICETLRRETELAIMRTGVSIPILYIESGLHEQPAQLRAALQERIDALLQYDRLLLSFGQCGNALVGITAHAELIFPRVEDCISLLIGAPAKRQALCAKCSTYFLTRGWLDGKRNLLAEYACTLEKYGEKRGNELFGEMLKGYRRIAVLDTDAFDPNDALLEAMPLCRALDLQAEILPASTAYLAQLLTGPWPADRFAIIPPGRTVTDADLLLP